MQANGKKKTSMLVKKHPFKCSPAAMHQNVTNSGLLTCVKKPVNFFMALPVRRLYIPK